MKNSKEDMLIENVSAKMKSCFENNFKKMENGTYEEKESCINNYKYFIG